MAASPSGERLRLLELVADHLLEHGVNDVSLSALARAVGSNNRMLLYYFGTKEELFDEAAQAALERFPGLRGLVAELGEDGDVAELLERAWLGIAEERNLPFLRLFFELFSLNTRHPQRNATYLRRVATIWRDAVAALLARRGYEADAARESATAVVAVWRGLQIELLAGTERELLLAAHRRAVSAILARQPVAAR